MLQLSDWARAVIAETETTLRIAHDELPVRLHGANATGQSLVSAGTIGADLLRLSAGARFPPHTHLGNHVLVVLGGLGTLTLGGQIHPTQAGQIYIVEGQAPHAVGAVTDHVILAVGAPHEPVDSPERMRVVEYQGVLGDANDLTCLICHQRSTAPARLHELGCQHCPCVGCCDAR